MVYRRTARRWTYLVLGGTLLTPYALLGSALAAAVPDGRSRMLVDTLVLVAVMLIGPPVTALLPAVRLMEATASRELLGGPLAQQPPSATSTAGAKVRAAAWFTTHVLGGAVMSVISLAVPTWAVWLLTVPSARRDVLAPALPAGTDQRWLEAVAVAVTVLAFAAFGLLVAVTGATLARLAPWFLGPTAADRLAALRREARRQALRNELARELHDSVGHVLSVVTIQAGAAGRVLDRDPEFARRALTAIEEAARSALADLDHVLGVLREEPRELATPTLENLDDLLRTTRLTGAPVVADLPDGLDTLPAAVSREAFRIAQECLTNAVRHAGPLPITLRMEVWSGRLRITVTNPMPAGAGTRSHRTGGRGLKGLLERVTVLNGTMTAGPDPGPDGERWRVDVHLPLGRPTSGEPAHPEPAHPEPAHPEPAHPEPAPPERTLAELTPAEPTPREPAPVDRGRLP